ncbi:DNA polymerase I [Fusobacterium sp. PH5-44]|uniref:DNA polymerase I n=1 Tax=unclassified Fusobacterium TaxID=2648384 RepID=UPI003D1EAB72
MKKLVLLDVSAIMYRAFFANMHFRTKTEPTGAVYGFTNTLLSIIDEFNPDYIGAAFDVKRSSLKRSEIYQEYKAQREAVPEDLLTQIPRIEEVLDYFNIKRIKIEGHEADDVLGTIASKVSQKDIEVIVVTGDKDLAQILDRNIKIALLGKGEGKERFKIIANDNDVKEYLGVTSDMIPDLFGLIGDASDGIPGVRKIGPKKAIPLLEKYHNLEGVYENLDNLSEISGIGKSIIENLKEDKDLAFLSRTLATIEKNLDIDCSAENFQYHINTNKLLDLFKTLEFKGLIRKLSLENNQNSLYDISTPVNNSVDSVVEKVPSKKVYEKIIKNFIVVNNENNFNILEESLKDSQLIGLLCSNAGIAISSDHNDFYIPLWHKSLLYSNYTDINKVKDLLTNFLGKVTSYNIKNLFNKGFHINNLYLDLMIGCHLLTSQTKENYDIPIKYALDHDLENYQERFGKEIEESLNPEEYGKFLAERTSGFLQCTSIIIDELQEKQLLHVLNTIEHPLIKILSAMETTGIKINPEYFKKFSHELNELILKNQEKIYELAMGEFNINSPKQMAEVLFMRLNINPVKKTKTGLSTDVDVLETLRDQGVEIAKYILEYRKLTKLKSTYVDTMPLLIDRNNRVHTTYNQIGTTTGRLSSSNPNLQNIPVRSDEGIKIRAGFIAKEGFTLLGIDYSQIELRVLGELSKDENLINAYNNNEDLHALTARKLFLDNDGDEITRDQRSMAKVINFSIIYGKTSFGLSKELSITPKEASEYIDKYFREYPRVKDFEGSIITYAEQHGYVETYFKRRRIIEGINSQNKNIKNQAQRMAVNAVIQGTAAEIIKKAMIEIHEKIKGKKDISLLLQVHDELIFEVDQEKADIYKEEIENIMRTCVKFENVKLDVNGHIGENWAKIK